MPRKRRFPNEEESTGIIEDTPSENSAKLQDGENNNSESNGESKLNNDTVVQDSPDTLDIKQSKRERVGRSASLCNLEPAPPDKAINIAVAARALFSLDAEHQMFESGGIQEYLDYQIEREEEPMLPGTAFCFVRALQYVNKCLKNLNDKDDELFNVILMSHNHAMAGVRLIRSVNYHDLKIERVCLTGGTNPVEYLSAYRIKLFLTSYEDEVEQALSKGVAAAAMFQQKLENPVKDQLRIAFDLDAVLFSDESERVYKEKGFRAFVANEQAKVDEPLQEGPLKDFASALGRMQMKFESNKEKFPENPIRTYIVTSRSAASAGERALKTLRSWGLKLDELHFLAGAPKAPILHAIKPHIFFDDQHSHIEKAQEMGTPAGHVTSGIAYNQWKAQRNNIPGMQKKFSVTDKLD